ncbi:MAG: hypothetical protein ACI868_001230, partial [Granulosicoccus sp.]
NPSRGHWLVIAAHTTIVGEYFILIGKNFGKTTS